MKKASSIVSSAVLIAVVLLLTRVEKVSAQGGGFSFISGPRPWTGACVDNGVATIQGLECLVGNILSVAVTVIGLAGFVMFIYGAFRYMLAGSDTKGPGDARKAITYAVIGLVVALSAYIILNLIAAFTGIDALTQFIIPTT